MPAQISRQGQASRARGSGGGGAPASWKYAPVPAQPPRQASARDNERAPHFQPPSAFFADSFSGRMSRPVVDTLTEYCAPSAIGAYAALP